MASAFPCHAFIKLDMVNAFITVLRDSIWPFFQGDAAEAIKVAK